MKLWMPAAFCNAVKNLIIKWLPAFCSSSLIILMTLPMVANAVIEIAPLSSEELEGRYRELIEELRCPKCQNQNLADSNSPISVDLREQVRVLLEEGKSDEEVVAYLVDRYGDFVRYRPAVKENTLVLWFGPAAVGLLGLLVIVSFIRRQRSVAMPKDDQLSPEEQARLNDLLAHKEQEDAR